MGSLKHWGEDKLGIWKEVGKGEGTVQLIGGKGGEDIWLMCSADRAMEYLN